MNANADAVDLVGVGRANAAAGGADGALAQETLGGLVNGDVIRRDYVCVGRYAQARGVDAAGVKCVDFVKQNLEVNDHAVRNNWDDARRQNA